MWRTSSTLSISYTGVFFIPCHLKSMRLQMMNEMMNEISWKNSAVASIHVPPSMSEAARSWFIR